MDNFILKIHSFKGDQKTMLKAWNFAKKTPPQKTFRNFFE